MDLANCSKIKSGIDGIEFNQIGLDFLIGIGKGNTTEANELRAKIERQKAEYSSLGCGKDLETNECINLDSEIQSLISTISDQMKLAVNDSRYNSTVESLKKKLAQLKLDYETKGCIAKVQKVQLESANEVVSQFTSLDEARIEEQASYQVKQRVFFGGLVLIAGLFILTAFNSKNK